ncbi:MAG: nucleoside 2-deoxyribosyltransferase [Candidatus Bathyarchaeota archaeon]|nr:nucleoside 2-deoxyribosyltransferase [Candidatus Bathyarchaeota archaeon]
MKIYFCGSIRGAPADKELYRHLIDHLHNHGEVLTEHSFFRTLNEEHRVEDRWIWETDTGWLRESDAVIAEITAPSHGVGYEIGLAESLRKPILCLYRTQMGRRASAMLTGNMNVEVYEYGTREDACKIIDEWLQGLRGGKPSRFSSASAIR